MFVGHLAVALGSHRLEPRAPLGALIAAAFGLDLLWPLFLLAGIESVRIEPGNTAFTPLNFVHYPWSHSLSMSVIWGIAAGRVAAAMLKNARAGLVIGLVVISHWVLDVVTHRPDLALYPGGPLAGLGLWNSIPGTFAVEGLLLVAAIAFYRRGMRAGDRQGVWAFWSLVVFCVLIWASGPFSPPPPSVNAIAIVGLAGAVVFPLWGIWIDKRQS